MYVKLCLLEIWSTLGGIRINENMQVLDKDFNVIKEGLYAAGADAGGMYGKAYVDFEELILGILHVYISGRLTENKLPKILNKRYPCDNVFTYIHVLKITLRAVWLYLL